MTEEIIPWGLTEEEADAWHTIRDLRGYYFMCPPQDEEQRRLYFTVYTILKHHSRSGIVKVFDLYIIRDNVMLSISSDVAKAVMYKYNQRHGGVEVRGCDKDARVVVEALSQAIYRPDLYEHYKEYKLQWKEMDLQDEGNNRKGVSTKGDLTLVTPISGRYATEDDYKRLQNWNVGTFHRASTLPPILTKRRITTMPVFKMEGPLPDGHPFKGTKIIFGMKRPPSSGTSSEKEESPDPFQKSLHEKNEESLSGLFPEKKAKGNNLHDVSGKAECQGEPHGDTQEDIVSKEVCSYCGKVFAELDENGCLVNDFGRCDDTIGEGDDGNFSFTKGFDIFYELLDLYLEIESGKEVFTYIHHLTGIEFTTDLSFSEILGLFPEIKVSGHDWDGGFPGNSGYYSYITVNRESQTKLLKKLTDIRDRLEMFVKAESFSEEIQAKLESPEN
jgi:hypothetical protein